MDVYFKGEKISSANVHQLEQKTSFDFNEKTTLEIRTEGKGILKINSLEITCSGKIVFLN